MIFILRETRTAVREWACWVTTYIKLVKPALVTTSIKLVKPALVTTCIKYSQTCFSDHLY